MRSAVTVVLVILGMAGTAVAQPGTIAAGVAPSAAPSEPVSDQVAIGISVGSTAASWALLAVAVTRDSNSYRGPMAVVGALGTVLAPSFGHWYAGSRPLRGLALRLAGLATLVGVGVLVAAQCDDECSSAAGGVVLIGGAGLYLAGTIDDVVRIPGAVRRYNEGLRGVTVVPAIQRDGGGLLIVGRF